MAIQDLRRTNPYSDEHYLQMLRRLLPRGRRWGFQTNSGSDVIYDTYSLAYDLLTDAITDDDTIYDAIRADFDFASTWLGRFLSVFAAELKRLTDRIYDLVNESVAGLSVELLPEWIDCTLDNNDEWTLISGSTADQQAFAHGKLYQAFKTTDVQYFIDYADLLDFTITIVENPAYSNILTTMVVNVDDGHRCGVAVDPVAQAGVFTCGVVRWTDTIEITITAGTGNLPLMQSLFDRIKPAHVRIVWIDARP